MYSKDPKSNPPVSITVQQMPTKELNWALTQVQNTIKKNKRKA